MVVLKDAPIGLFGAIGDAVLVRKSGIWIDIGGMEPMAASVPRDAERLGVGSGAATNPPLGLD